MIDNARRLCKSLTLLIVMVVLIPATCLASASRLGPSFNASNPWPQGSRRVDVAYDPVNDVYLVVSGSLPYPSGVYGRFVDGNGNPIGSPFPMTQTNAHTSCPRLAYSPALGGFLVVWWDLRLSLHGQVWGRYVKFQAGGTPVFVTNDIDIANPPAVRSSSTPAVACAGAMGECLVAWQRVDGRDNIRAIRLNLAGQPLANEYALTNNSDWNTDPNIAYDPVTGVYVVVHTVFNNTGLFGEVWEHRIKAGSGEQSGPIHVAQGLIAVPQVVRNVATGQFLVAWFDFTGPAFYGRFIGADGSPASNVVPLLKGYNSADAFSGAYNAVSGTFVFVLHGLTEEDAAFQVSGQGVPDPPFVATSFEDDDDGNFYPKIASHTQRAEWLMVTSTNFNFVGAQRISSTETGGPGNGPPPPPTTIDLSPQGAPNGSWFLAEGVANLTGNGFKTFYLLENPNPVPVNVRVYFSDAGGIATAKQITVPASSRTTVSLIDQVGPGTFGTVFQSLTTDPACPGTHCDIDLERSIFWGPNLKGSTDATAVNHLSNAWYFAEGSRGGELFNNYFPLFNPNQTATQVTGTFYRADGQVVTRTYNVGPQQRLTVDANAIPELAGADFATSFTAGMPIVAERSMYWGWDPNNFWTGGHATVGATAASSTWYFAEGNAAPNFESFFLLLNPNTFPIVVNANFLTESSGPVPKTYTVPAKTRLTVLLNAELGNIGPAGVVFSTTDNSQFLAERSIYWGGRIEGSNTIGAPTPASIWDLPEGSTTSLFDTYAAVMNPTANPVPFTATAFIEGMGMFTAPTQIIPPFSRKTFNMKDVLGALQQQTGLPVKFSSFSMRVQTVNAADKIVVEHSRYWNFVGGNLYWLSGGASMGIPH